MHRGTTKSGRNLAKYPLSQMPLEVTASAQAGRPPRIARTSHRLAPLCLILMHRSGTCAWGPWAVMSSGEQKASRCPCSQRKRDSNFHMASITEPGPSEWGMGKLNHQSISGRTPTPRSRQRAHMRCNQGGLGLATPPVDHTASHRGRRSSWPYPPTRN